MEIKQIYSKIIRREKRLYQKKVQETRTRVKMPKEVKCWSQEETGCDLLKVKDEGGNIKKVKRQ